MRYSDALKIARPLAAKAWQWRLPEDDVTTLIALHICGHNTLTPEQAEWVDDQRFGPRS